jgi:hypothetical protein
MDSLAVAWAKGPLPGLDVKPQQREVVDNK